MVESQQLINNEERHRYLVNDYRAIRTPAHLKEWILGQRREYKKVIEASVLYKNRNGFYLYLKFGDTLAELEEMDADFWFSSAEHSSDFWTWVAVAQETATQFDDEWLTY